MGGGETRLFHTQCRVIWPFEMDILCNQLYFYRFFKICFENHSIVIEERGLSVRNSLKSLVCQRFSYHLLSFW